MVVVVLHLRWYDFPASDVESTERHMVAQELSMCQCPDVQIDGRCACSSSFVRLFVVVVAVAGSFGRHLGLDRRPRKRIEIAAW